MGLGKAMRQLILTSLLALAVAPMAAWATCGNYSGVELYEPPANRAVEAYIASRSLADQRKACDRTRLALKHWKKGVEYCEERPECTTTKFKSRCDEIAERVVLWTETERLVCDGL